MPNLARTLARGRAASAARMPSRAKVRRPAGRVEASNGLKVTAWQVVYEDVPFELSGEHRGASSSRTLTLPGGLTVQVALRVGKFTTDTSDPADGDHIEITAGENAGLVLRIVEGDWQDNATTRRVPVFAVPRPTEWE